MKTKRLLMIILNAKCLMFSFIFFLLFNIQHSTFNIVCAQPAKVADKLAPEGFNRGSVTTNLPSIIKKIDIPWPVSAAVDEKENRLFVMSAAGEDSAVFVLNGKDMSTIKKIGAGVKEGFESNLAGNGMVYNENTKRLYAALNARKNGNAMVMIDAKLYKVLSVIKSPFKEKTLALSLNLSKKHNMVYAVSAHWAYVYGFNGANGRLEQETDYGKVYEGGGGLSAISEDGDFLYINTPGKFVKFDTKTKKVAAALPINIGAVPFIDGKNGLIFAGIQYKLYIIDLNTFKIKDEREDIPVSSGSGFSITLNPTTNHLFVPTYNDSVSVVDVNIMEIITTIKVGQTVRSIAVNSKTNRVYVTLSEGKVVVIQDR